MRQAMIIGVDLAKCVCQSHGADEKGHVVFSKKLNWPAFSTFIAEEPPCLFAMEACATSHFWARWMKIHGHEVRLIAPISVKPFVKRQKNDVADAEAIVETAHLIEDPASEILEEARSLCRSYLQQIERLDDAIATLTKKIGVAAEQSVVTKRLMRTISQFMENIGHYVGATQ